MGIMYGVADTKVFLKGEGFFKVILYRVSDNKGVLNMGGFVNGI